MRTHNPLPVSQLKTMPRPELLPTEWDDSCGTFLRQKRMLVHYEKYNPCCQRYYCLYRRGRLVAGAIVYSRTQDLLTFVGRIPSPVQLNIVGIPASISPAGVWGDAKDAAELLNGIFAREKGLTLVLNLPADFPRTQAHASRLLPGMLMDNRFESFADYERELRSPWRRRLRLTRRKFSGVRTVRENCAAFTSRHHGLYLEVREQAPEKMETLSCEFFRQLPAPIELVSCYQGQDLLCWRLVLAEKNRLIFLLGGHDYGLNDRFGAYFNNLCGVVEDGIRTGAAHIDFGQTAEDPKARLGAIPVPEKMLLHHSNPLWHKLLGLSAPVLAYHGSLPQYHVFKREGGLS